MTAEISALTDWNTLWLVTLTGDFYFICIVYSFCEIMFLKITCKKFR